MAFLFKNVPRVEARAAICSVVVSILLLGIKYAAYALTGSTTVFADTMEQIVNVAASSMAAYALIQAHSPADDDHPYGHGKIEFLSAGIEGIMIIAVAVVVAYKAAFALVGQNIVEQNALDSGVALVALAMAVNGVVGWYLISTGKKVKSVILEADGWHLMSDAITSVAALAALGIVRLTHRPAVDPILAIAVSFYIAFTGLGLVRRSGAGLMDKQDRGDESLLEELLRRHVGPDGQRPQICSFHKLRHRHSGRFHWVDFHIMVPGWWDVRQAHHVASTIEHEIETALEEGNATAHIEPCPDLSCPLCAAGHGAPAVAQKT